MKDAWSSSLDRLSNLPSPISQIILMSLPLRDMARTSILSKSWRDQWLKVPQMVFKDDPEYFLSRDEKYRYSLLKVFEILLLHQGPILKFTLDMTAWVNSSGIDAILIFLSRNGIKELSLLMSIEDPCHKLSSSILSCVELRHLSLYGCVFQPLIFVGFNNLVSLELLKVTLYNDVTIASCPLLESLKLDNLRYFDCFSVDAPNLKFLFFKGCFCRISYMNTPLLQVLSLTGEDHYAWNDSKFNLLSLIRSLPLLENLHLYHRFLKFLVVGDSLKESTTELNNLKLLEVTNLTFGPNNISSILWLIWTSINLQKLKMTLSGQSPLQLEEPVDLEHTLKVQEPSDYLLLKLQEMEMELGHKGSDMRSDVKFMKCVLDISPNLETIYIKPVWEHIDVSGCKMLIDLACYPRASPKSKLVCVGLDVS